MGYWCHFHAEFRTPLPIVHIIRTIPEDWLWADRLDIRRDDNGLNVDGDIEDESIFRVERWFDIAVDEYGILGSAVLHGADDFNRIVKTYKEHDVDIREVKSVWEEVE